MPYWKMYTIVIQAGAILALLLLYLGRILEFFRTFPRGERGDRTIFTHPLSLTIIAFICTSIPALLLKKWSDRNLSSLTVIAIALLAGGIIMWVVDAWASRFEPNTIHVEEMTFAQSVWIGLCQSLSAIFPGTSRSMSTIAAGQTRRHGPAHGPRVQLPAVDSDHARGHWLRPAEGDSPEQGGPRRRHAQRT